MAGEAIFGPFFGMVLLTFLVWVYMYVRRLSYVKAHRVEAQQLTTAVRRDEIIPEEVSYPAYNLRNLFELPVLFYAVCLYLYVAQQVDAIYVGAAWIFLAFRVVHSVIHCTTNVVMARFTVYMCSALVLWFIVLRAAAGYLLQLRRLLLDSATSVSAAFGATKERCRRFRRCEYAVPVTGR